MKKVYFTLIFLIGISSCTHIEFKSRGEIPSQISHNKNQRELIQLEGIKEFYYWGHIPKKHIVYVDSELQDAGFISSSGISVTSYLSLKSWLQSVFSLGMYTPINYRIKASGVTSSEK